MEVGSEGGAEFIGPLLREGAGVAEAFEEFARDVVGVCSGTAIAAKEELTALSEGGFDSEEGGLDGLSTGCELRIADYAILKFGERIRNFGRHIKGQSRK